MSKKEGKEKRNSNQEKGRKMGKVIINSDDFGYSSGIDYGIMEAHKKGILTSTTLMTNTPGFEQAVKMAKGTPSLGIGIHLTLTFLKPLNNHVGSLTDSSGYFHKLSEYKMGTRTVDLDELYEEWNAQIQKAIQNGIQPTHLDSHHHLHTFCKHHEVVTRLAEQYDLPVRGNFEQKAAVKTTDYFEPDFDLIGTWLQEEKDTQKIEPYIDQLIDKLRQYDSTEIMCHAGYIDQFLATHTSFSVPRIYQTDFLIHSSFADRLKEDSSIQLVTFKDI